MNLTDILSANRVTCDMNVSSKKQLFQEMAQLIVESGAVDPEHVTIRDIVASTMERERLGSTGVGSGVALPHARIPSIDSVIAAFARLETPLEYDAVDERDVDLVIMLLAPEHANGEHLRALAQVSRRLRREELRQRLRKAPNAESLYVVLLDNEAATT